jgi:uncharacterized membrane protein YgdD (TMEM256/DUF423 family)|tara:strand:- start:663 stop:1013 length:351 start_codon:yes stop_codon:yes gene_type:complete
LILIKLGILFAVLSVIIGAFGAHGLESTIKDKMEIYKTGVQYQMFHSLALVAVGILSITLSKDLNDVGYIFSLGIVLFSGSLYLIAVKKLSFLGMVTPFGGALFIVGWALLLYKLA